MVSKRLNRKLSSKRRPFSNKSHFFGYNSQSPIPALATSPTVLCIDKPAFGVLGLMCGIAGIINFNYKSVNQSEIHLMMQKMKHRGPDDEGMFIDDNVGLGFVRLSILDLSSAGHQPMFSNDGRYVIIYNGEVYNYLELRNELKHKYEFKSNTDTEVVLVAYQVWGEDCLGKFNGMFAFIIYDTIKKPGT